MKTMLAILSPEAKEAEEIIKSLFMEQIDILEEGEFLEGSSEKIAEHERIIVCGTLPLIKACIEACLLKEKTLAIIPLPDQKFLSSTFFLPMDYEKAIRLAMEGESVLIDLLRCNEEIVLNSVVIGNVPLFGKSRYGEEYGFFEKISIFIEKLREIRNITLHSFNLKTQKEQEIKTAASGIYIFEHNNKNLSTNLLGDRLTATDGKLSAILVSPFSILNYVTFLTQIILSKKKIFSKMPESIGFVKSAALEITSERPYSVLIDKEIEIETPVKLEVEQQILNIVAGKEFFEVNETTTDDKESIKIETMPTEKERTVIVERPLPLFSTASEERYKNLFVSLREESRTNAQYLTLMILSTLLATLGIFLDSASVVIGAMLLAPLMAPIVSFSMGVLRKDHQLFYNSLKTVGVGVGVALFASAFFTYLMPFNLWTSELMSRLHPSLLDLLVAVLSGIAAAFAKADIKISQNLAGVAIAVALIPPLSVVGIGIGWMNGHIIINAMLLFLTNLVGIVLAAVVTFYLLGFSVDIKGKRSFWILGLVMLLIAFPLYLSMGKMIRLSKVQGILNNKTVLLADEHVKISDVQILSDEEVLVIRCTMSAKKEIQPNKIEELKTMIENTMRQKIELEVRFIRLY